MSSFPAGTEGVEKREPPDKRFGSGDGVMRN